MPSCGTRLPCQVQLTPPVPPCDLHDFVQTTVNPCGSTSQIAEPSAAFDRDTTLSTWNWDAALSRSAGVTWSCVNPCATGSGASV